MKIDKTAIEDVFPMSDVSKGMIYHSLKNTSSHMFHEQSVRFIEIPDFSKEVFERTMDLLVERHEMLRSIFSVFEYKEPVQIVLKTTTKDIDYIDISDKTTREKEEFLNAWLEQDRKNPFKLSDLKPLWRVRIFSITKDSICFVWVAHHAISEGWSAASILTEINNTYLNLVKDRSYRPEKLKGSYKTYVAEQIKEKSNPENYAFWKKKLEGCKKLELPFIQYREDKLKDSGFITKKYDLTVDLREALKRVAEAENTSLKNLCFTAYVYCLYFFSNERDVVVGLLANNRPAIADGDKIFGCFLNTIPYRHSFSGHRTWHQLFAEVQEELNACLRYGRLPFIEILNTIEYANETENPLFDTMFNYIDFHVYDDLIIEVDKQSEELSILKNVVKGEQKDNLFLTFMLNARNGFHCELLFYDAVINPSQVDYIMSVFTRILHKMAYHGKEIASKQALFASNEAETITKYTRSEYPLGTTVAAIISNQVAKTPDRTAISYQHRQVSFKTLEVEAKGLAGYLQGQGVGPGSVVGIYLDRSVDSVISMVAVAFTGAAYLPLSIKLPQMRIAYMLADSQCSLVISDQEYCSALTGNVTCVDVSSRAAWTEPVEDPEAILYTMYTSGSTGQPKGVMVTHRNVINLIYGLQDVIYKGYGEALKLGLVSPFDFDASVQHVYGSLMLGHTLCVAGDDERANGNGLVDFYAREKVDISDGTPTHLRLIRESGRQLPGKVKHFLIAGETLPKELASKFLNDHAVRITNLYGPTETCVDSTYFHIEKEHIELYDAIPIGKPLPNEQILILSEDGQMQGINIPGELVIAGEGVSKGYRRLPAGAEATFVPSVLEAGKQMYKTGDKGFWLPDGNIAFIGRKDNQVKLRGYRIELDEIQKQLLAIEGIKNGVVCIEKDSLQEDSLVCYYTLNPGSDKSKDDIIKQLSITLPVYMLPQKVQKLTSLPVKENGKIDKSRLSSMQAELLEEKSKPTNEVEEKIVLIWASVLERQPETIGVNEEFVHLGGHSLRLMKSLAQIQKEFNVKISLKDILISNTVRKLAEIINKSRSLAFMPIGKAAPQAHYPLSQAQLNIYLFQQKERESIVYNMPQFYEFVVTPDLAKLNLAFHQLMQRQEIVRTIFTEINGAPAQRILPANEQHVVIEEYRCTRVEEIKNILQAFVRPFDLEKAPLMRLGVLQCEDRSFLLIDLHHIVSDRISNQLLAKEFVDLYLDKEPEASTLHYTDFIAWINQDAAMKQLAEQEQYWMKQFKTAPKIVQLPTKRLENGASQYDAGTVKFALDAGEVQLIHALCNTQRVSAFALLFSVYSIALSKITKEQDVSVAIPLSGRSHADMQKIIGNFVNITILRNNISEEKTFQAVLHQVNEVVYQAFENQYYNIDNLISKLTTEHQVNFKDLLHVAFDLVHTEATSATVEASQLFKATDIFERKTTPYQILLVGNVTDQRISFSVDYEINLISRTFVDYFIETYTGLLKTILNNPGVCISELDLPGSLEEAQAQLEDVVGEFNF